MVSTIGVGILVERYQAYIEACRKHGSTLKDAEIPFAEANYTILVDALSDTNSHTPLDIRIQNTEFMCDKWGILHEYPKYTFRN